MTKETADDVCSLMNKIATLQRDIEALNEALNDHKNLRVLDISGFYSAWLSSENIIQLIESKRKELKDMETELTAL